MPDDFDMFALNQPDPPVDQNVDQKPDAKPAMVTLTEDQFNQILENQNEERRRNQEMWQSVLQGQPQVQEQPQPKFEINLDGLPDPRIDLEGYHKGLAERMGQTFQTMEQRALENAQGRVNAERQQAGIFDQAWAKFQTDYPDLAEFPEVVQMAVAGVFDGIRARGLEPMRLLTTNMDDIIGDVAAQSAATITRIRGDSEDNQDDAGRTDMLDAKGPRPRAKTKPDNYDQDDFLKSIRKTQQELRIY